MTFATLDQMFMAYFVYGLVLLRCSAAMVFAPFFGANQFPVLVRVSLAAAMSLVLYSAAARTAAAGMPAVLNTPDIFFLALQEVVLGLTIGFFGIVVFLGIQFAGSIAGMQMSFAVANLVDPLTDQQVSIFGVFQMNLAVMIFLALNLHMGYVYIIQESFRFVGVGSLVFGKALAPLGEAAVYETAAMVMVGVRLAAPIVVIMLLNSVVEGFVTRTMPQMNIMVLGFPLRVAMGLTVFMLLVPALVSGIETALTTMIGDLHQLVTALGSATAA